MIAVAHLIDTLRVGGAQRLLVTFAAATRTRGVTLAVLSLRDEPGSPIAVELDSLDVKRATIAGRGLLDPLRVVRLAARLRRDRVAVLHTHLTYATVIGALAGRLAGVPVVTTLHTAGQDPRHFHPLRFWLETLALRHGSSRVLAVGESVAQAHASRLGGKPVRVIRNAVPLPAALSSAERAAVRAEIGVGQSRPLLISVGRLSLPKAVGDLLDAFADLRRTHPSAALVIVGGGELRHDLAASIERLGLAGHALLLGQRSDVPRLLAAADLYVSASHWEGLPVAVLEAMGAGLPIVATEVGELPHLVQPSAGVLVPARDPSALAAAMRGVLDEPDRMRAMGAAARVHVQRQFSPAAWADQLLGVYDDLCHRPPQLARQAR